MHGAGNDFMLLDLRRQKLALDRGLAAALADRRTGVGCDQLLILRPPRDAGVARFEIRNADGSRAEQCGNGVRCIALYLQRRGEVSDEAFVLEGPVGNLKARCLSAGTGANAIRGEVEVEMGRPGCSAPEIPTTLPVQNGAVSLELEGRRLELGVVSMGNPHAVLLLTEDERHAVRDLGARVSRHPAFPEGCNVGFARVAGPDTLELQVYERGSGATRACGSGACAAAFYAHRRGLVQSPVRVIQPGGVLIIGVAHGDGPVRMTGPAQHVYEGILA
jgi:diaminopimelate epimerase